MPIKEIRETEGGRFLLIEENSVVFDKAKLRAALGEAVKTCNALKSQLPQIEADIAKLRAALGKEAE